MLVDRPRGSGADERPGQGPQRSAHSDELHVGPGVTGEQGHDGQTVGEHGRGDPGGNDLPSDEVGGGRGVEEDRLVRVQQLDGGPRQQSLCPAGDVQAPVKGVLVSGGGRKHGAAVRTAGQSATFEFAEIASRGHRRDAEARFDLRDGHRAGGQ